MAKGWRYLARRLNGNGTETPLHHDLPLLGVSLDRELSGPGGMKAYMAPESDAGNDTADGDPIFVEGQTALYAEKDGVIRHGFILTDIKDDGPALRLEATGFTNYAKDQSYNGDYSVVNADPMNIVRHLWAHLQTKEGGNIGLIIDDTTSPVRVGKPLPKGASAGQEGPFTMGYWDTKDVGSKLDELANETPYDYIERHSWSGENIKHELILGYPEIGSRRTDLRFMVGENVAVNPAIDYTGKDYATSVIMLGAGEGRKTIRGIAVEPGTPSRLRRVVTLENKALTTQAAADKAAARALALRKPLPDFSTLRVRDHENAPIGSYEVGDQIQVKTRGGWHKGLDLWVRIIAVTTDPQKMTDTLSVLRTDKVE